MEVALYDGKGQPVAYIADDGEHSIYLWDGHAVAYVDGKSVHGWNGKHLGWFVDGVLYNPHGGRVGSIGEKCPYAVHAQPAKYAKYARHAKYARYAAYARPALSSGYSSEPLDAFLKDGAVGSA